MTRIGRIVGVNLPHHITQRGNYQQEVFLSDADRIKYLSWMAKYSLKYGLKILAYCLMPNHAHFIAIPKMPDSLAKTFKITHMLYSQYVNKNRSRVGHLWQGRFYSCILDGAHFLLAVRYVERNPVRAGLAKKPWDWQWSSALAHTTEKANCLFDTREFFLYTGITYTAWKEYIDFVEEQAFLNNIRKHTHTGQPFKEKRDRHLG